MASHDGEEELFDEEPPVIEPYEVLGVEKAATPDEIKSAYRKSALKHHPDKVAADQKDIAHTKFQELVFAYSILSNPLRRARYDATGSTAETIDSDDFNWSEYYRSQFSDVITGAAIEKFSREYKGSVEEKDDVLAAYRKGKGAWQVIYELVMLSNPLEDEERYRAIIDQGVENGEVKIFESYSKETKENSDARMEEARNEGKEAMAYAEKLGVKEKLFGADGKSSSKKGLADLIKSRQAERSSFLDQLEAKYAGDQKSRGKKGKKGKDQSEIPDEEAFQAAAAKMSRGWGKKRVSEDEDQGEMPDEAAFQAAAARLNGRKAKKSKQ